MTLRSRKVNRSRSSITKLNSFQKLVKSFKGSRRSNSIKKKSNRIRSKKVCFKKSNKAKYHCRFL